MIFKGSGCFQFPEAVLTLQQRKPTLYRTGITTCSNCFIGAETAATVVTNFGREGKPECVVVHYQVLICSDSYDTML